MGTGGMGSYVLGVRSFDIPLPVKKITRKMVCNGGHRQHVKDVDNEADVD